MKNLEDRIPIGAIIYSKGKEFGEFISYDNESEKYGSIRFPDGDVVTGWRWNKRRWETQGWSWKMPKSSNFTTLYKKLST